MLTDKEKYTILKILEREDGVFSILGYMWAFVMEDERLDRRTRNVFNAGRAKMLDIEEYKRLVREGLIVEDEDDNTPKSTW